jgi:demethylmenaquinone methyltransferase/2-methoxy-6-polyprenyl-1,4-benzoquinol methylase
VTETLHGVEKARFVSAMFSRIARRYDLMNGLMTLGMHHNWRRVAARQTIASPDGPALDLATGTGDLAIDLAEVHPHRTVVAADFSLGMLAVARDKLQGLEETRRVRLLAADALALPFATQTFACVTSAFLLRNLADLEQGLREMRRVTRPGGRVVALEITQMRAPASPRCSASTSTTWCPGSGSWWAATARRTATCRSRWTAS